MQYDTHESKGGPINSDPQVPPGFGLLILQKEDNTIMCIEPNLPIDNENESGPNQEPQRESNTEKVVEIDIDDAEETWEVGKAISLSASNSASNDKDIY